MTEVTIESADRPGLVAATL